MSSRPDMKDDKHHTWQASDKVESKGWLQIRRKSEVVVISKPTMAPCAEYLAHARPEVGASKAVREKSSPCATRPARWPCQRRWNFLGFILSSLSERGCRGK